MPITIDEAIKKLTALGQGRFAGSLAEEEEAQKLGAEALKRIKDAREFGAMAAVDPLRGETEE